MDCGTRLLPLPFVDQTFAPRNKAAEVRLLCCTNRRADCLALLVLAAMIAPIPIFTI